MKIIVLIFLVLLGLTCKEQSFTRPILIKKDVHANDSLVLKDIILSGDIYSTSLVIKNDTVFFILQPRFDKSKAEFVRILYYDSLNKKYHFTVDIWPADLSDSIKIKLFFNRPEIYLKSLLKPDITYSKPTYEMKNDIRIKKALNHPSKIQAFKNSYYLINTQSPKELLIYDTLTHNVKILRLNTLIMRMFDFFLYDIDKDGSPEIFILHEFLLPHDEVISYSIYSLRSVETSISPSINSLPH